MMRTRQQEITEMPKQTKINYLTPFFWGINHSQRLLLFSQWQNRKDVSFGDTLNIFEHPNMYRRLVRGSNRIPFFFFFFFFLLDCFPWRFNLWFLWWASWITTTNKKKKKKKKKKKNEWKKKWTEHQLSHFSFFFLFFFFSFFFFFFFHFVYTHNYLSYSVFKIWLCCVIQTLFGALSSVGLGFRSMVVTFSADLLISRDMEKKRAVAAYVNRKGSDEPASHVSRKHAYIILTLPLKPHFYIVKLGFTGVYIIFSYFCSKHRLWYSLEPPRRYKYKKYHSFFCLKIFTFWRWNCLYIWIGVFS